MAYLLVFSALLVVFWSQWRAIPHLHRLFFDTDKKRLRNTIVQAGLQWGLLGLGLLELTVLALGDPALVDWMFSSGVVVLFFATALGWTCWFAWAMAHHFHSQWLWGVNLSVSALLLTLDYPILKLLQTGQWALMPEHLLQFVIHLLVFSTLLKVTASTAGLSRVQITAQALPGLWRLTSPALGALVACVLASLVFVQTAWAINPLVAEQYIPPVQGLFSTVNTLRDADHWPIAVGSLCGAAFSLWGFEVSRRLNVMVEDAFLWTSTDSPISKGVLKELSNTRLIRSTLDMSRIGMVFWRSPMYEQGVGAFDLRTGYTYISSGFIHDKGLQQAGAFANLPDFWRVGIHPDDLQGFEDLQVALHDPQRNRFAHIARFAATDGSWLYVKGEATVERDGKGRPLAFYGIHTDITDQINDNSRLTVSNQRKLFAMRWALP